MAPRVVLLSVCVLALGSCGADKPAASPKTTTGTSSNTEFGARDWTLPVASRPELVIDWYIARLQARGWEVKGKSFNTIRATRGHASLSVGVRQRTLEVIANSRGA